MKKKLCGVSLDKQLITLFAYDMILGITFRTYVWLSRGRKAHHGGRPNYGGSGAPSQPNHPSQLSTNTPHPQPIIIAANAILIGAQHPTNDFMCHMHHQTSLKWVAPVRLWHDKVDIEGDRMTHRY